MQQTTVREWQFLEPESPVANGQQKRHTAHIVRGFGIFTCIHVLAAIGAHAVAAAQWRDSVGTGCVWKALSCMQRTTPILSDINQVGGNGQRVELIL
jgi:transposase